MSPSYSDEDLSETMVALLRVHGPMSAEALAEKFEPEGLRYKRIWRVLCETAEARPDVLESVVDREDPFRRLYWRAR